MKRRNFIKALAAACAVPVVAAKAISGAPQRISIPRTYDPSFGKVSNREDLLARVDMKTPSEMEIDSVIESIWRESGDLKDGHIFIKPEDAPLYKPRSDA